MLPILCTDIVFVKVEEFLQDFSNCGQGHENNKSSSSRNREQIHRAFDYRSQQDENGLNYN
jgi:hypothetical protein